jgi:hypothetical protein
MKPQYEWVKKGSYWVRFEKIVNRWNGEKPPIEDNLNYQQTSKP